MTPKTINIAIMFADIADSTKLYDTLGNQLARAKVVAALEVMSEITNQNNGTVIKTIGDEVMCTFPASENAGTAAWEIQEAFEAAAESDSNGSPVAIRVGMHFGLAIMKDGDVFGDAVNIAARMVAQAKAKQIITTQDTRDKLPPMMRASTRFVDRVLIKGKKGVTDIFEIIWQEEDTTRKATGMIITHPTPETKLSLTYNGQTIELNKLRPTMVMGRGQNCDFTINEKQVSRQHLRIELRRDKFFIVDQSTNGTHVITGDNHEEFLHREGIPLTGSGRISLGRGFNEDPDEGVRFTLTSVMVKNKSSTSFSWSSFGITNIGKVRKHNEDSILDKPEIGLWVVADGMGGHESGDIASQMIVKSLGEIHEGSRLDQYMDDIEDRLLKVNEFLITKARESGKDVTIGSTVVGMAAYDRFCIFFWAGDSRLYRLRNGSSRQLTIDHSQVEIYIEQGLISRKEAATHPHSNVITRAVGVSENLNIDFDIQEMRSGDRYMLCSDGLTKHLEDVEFEEILSEGNVGEACKKLITLTLERGAGDNVSTIVVDIE